MDDVIRWLADERIFNLTNFFIEPGHEFCTNLDEDYAFIMFNYCSAENVENIFRILGMEIFLKQNIVLECHNLFRILSRNPYIPADFIYKLLQQYPNDDTKLKLSKEFLSDILACGNRDKVSCRKIIQFIIDKKIKLSYRFPPFDLKIMTGYDDELKQLIQLDLLDTPKSESNIETPSAIDHLQKIIDQGDNAEPNQDDLAMAVKHNFFPAIQFFVERCGLPLTPEMLSVAVSIRGKPGYDPTNGC